MMMGDLNGVVNPTLDRTGKGEKNKQGKLPQSFFRMVEKFDMKDTWRFKNELEKGFTYFSHAKRMASRIDTIWLSKELINRVKEIKTEPRTISDHNSILMQLEPESISGIRRWKLNNSLLYDEKILEGAKKELEEFF